ncbi:MAG: UDP-N-acetylmuramate dehydrogenase [Clostridium sp.]|nr:UDP-N-acetylmuramate dehydrogenase [Clostridium sp.]
MNQFLKYKELFYKIYKDDEIEFNADMKQNTSFKVGGTADVLLCPKEYSQLQETVRICNENNIPFIVLGNGSNILVRDGGIREVVIKLTSINFLEISQNKIKAGSGVSLKEVSDFALENSLTGFEFACGIPGSVGGAVFMNAGAYNGEIKNVITQAEVLDREGNIKTLDREQLSFDYRKSNIMEQGYIVLSAVFTLEYGDKETIKSTIDDLTARREEKQPLEYPSAGSTFKRPKGYFAGKLIQDCELKGFTIGGAAVSEKHSGFVINKGNATAKDVLDVISHVQETVMQKFGVKLETEVRIIGEEK